MDNTGNNTERGASKFERTLEVMGYMDWLTPTLAIVGVLVHGEQKIAVRREEYAEIYALLRSHGVRVLHTLPHGEFFTFNVPARQVALVKRLLGVAS